MPDYFEIGDVVCVKNARMFTIGQCGVVRGFPGKDLIAVELVGIEYEIVCWGRDLIKITKEEYDAAELINA